MLPEKATTPGAVLAAIRSRVDDPRVQALKSAE
jgi:hypothetical protein